MVIRSLLRHDVFPTPVFTLIYPDSRQSPEVRDWLSLHAPWFDDFIAIASEENLTYREFAEETYECMKKCINNYFNDTKPKKCSLDGGEVPPVQG